MISNLAIKRAQSVIRSNLKQLCFKTRKIMANPKLEPSIICVKNLIFGVNCLFVLTGMLLISIGATIKGVYNNFDALLEASNISPASFILAIGIIIFAVALFGCLGAVKESTCLINMYTLCLIIIFIFEIAAALAGFANHTSLKNVLTTNMKDAIRTYASENRLSGTIDSVQQGIGCCGADSPLDWQLSDIRLGWNLTDESVLVPNSCCGEFNSNNETECIYPYTVGCLPTLIDWAETGAMFLTGTAIIVAVIQAMMIYFANELAWAIRRAKSVRAARQMEIRSNLVSNNYEPMNKAEPDPVIYFTANGNTVA